MNDVLTLGDAMITFVPTTKGPMRFVNSYERKIGGAELNFAIGCARLGLKTGFISRLGKDEFGRYIFNFIRGEGIDVSEIKYVDHYPTSINFREILEDGTGRTFYYRDRSPMSVLTEGDINENYIRNAKVIHFTGVYAAIHPDNIRIIEHALNIAKKYGVKISFDPNIRLRLWDLKEARRTILKLLPYADFIFSAEQEAEWLFGKQTIENHLKEYQNFGAEHILITRGGKGVVGYHRGETIRVKAKKARKVIDTVGAGDGFNAGYIYSFLNGNNFNESLHFANTIGSMVVTVSGDNEGLPLLDDVQTYTGNVDFIER